MDDLNTKMKAVSLRGLMLVALLCAGVPAYAQERFANIHLLLMNSTYRLVGEGSEGTAFLLFRPLQEDPTKGRVVLVTAAHVLEEMKGERAFIVMRRMISPTSWQTFLQSVEIRKAGQPAWVKHPLADVAVAYLDPPPPDAAPLPSVELLADDASLAHFEINPGDEVHCLGYPLGADSGPSGFPVLRSGKIASYPLLPTRDTRQFLLDIRVFPGNSGGPVYFVQANRTYGGAVNIGATIQMILGVLSKQRLATQQISELYAKREQSYPLELGEVVHASLIRELISTLPDSHRFRR